MHVLHSFLLLCSPPYVDVSVCSTSHLGEHILAVSTFWCLQIKLLGTLMYSFCVNVHFCFSGQMSKNDIARSHGSCAFSFRRNCQMVFKVAEPFYIPTSNE